MDTACAPSYGVIDNGKTIGPIDDHEVDVWRDKSANVIYDLVANELIITPLYREERKRIVLWDHAALEARTGQKVLATHLRLLRALAERPGRPVTQEVCPDLSALYVTPNTLAKYIFVLRRLLGDDPRSPHALIQTVRNLSAELSPTGNGYVANPHAIWRVIRYADRAFNTP